jgi:hypothetical protein
MIILLTFTVIIGIILIGLLLFVLGKLTWLESATTSLLAKIDISTPENTPQQVQMDPYFYGLSGQTLWKCLIGEDTVQATQLELEEIKPRYGIALVKSLVKFIKDGIDVGSNVSAKNTLFECEKLVFTSRGQIGIWLPADRVENFRILGMKMAKHAEEASEKEDDRNELQISYTESIREEITAEIRDLCELLQLRHGNDTASDVIKAFSSEINA